MCTLKRPVSCGAEEAWITNGTGHGTRRLVDACPGECSGIRPIESLQDAFPGPSGKTYFRSEEHTSELQSH